MGAECMTLAATMTRIPDLCRLQGSLSGIRFLSILLAVCSCVMLMPQAVVARNGALPNLDTWVSHEAADHGYTFKAPPDWRLSNPDPNWRETIIHLHHPSYDADCGLEYTPAKTGAEVDIDDVLEYMTDERLLEVASREFSSVAIHDKRTVHVSGRKGLLSAFSGIRDAQWLTVMTFTTVRANNIYRLQCFTPSENATEVYWLFLGMGKSLEIRPD